MVGFWGCGDYVSKSYISIQGITRERWQLSTYRCIEQKKQWTIWRIQEFQNIPSELFCKFCSEPWFYKQKQLHKLMRWQDQPYWTTLQSIAAAGLSFGKPSHLTRVINSPITRQTTEGEIHMKYCKWEYEESCACWHWGEVSCCRTHLKN